MGTSERTELDAHFESLADRADTTKLWTEKLLRNTEAVLTPNPGNRAEDFIFEKIEKKKPKRLSNLEYLGLEMIEVSLEMIFIQNIFAIENVSVDFIIFSGWRRVWKRRCLWKCTNKNWAN